MPTYDLSQPLESGMPVYPGTPPVEIERTATVAEDGYATTGLSFDSHTGTHIDAPAHMLADGRTLDSFDPETFRFIAAVADCRPLEPRSAIEPDDLEAATTGLGDELAGPDGEVDLLLCRTGWERHWRSDQYFDHPYLTNESGEWLVDRRLNLGIDAPNVDPSPGNHADPNEPEGYPFHHVMFAAERVLLENLRGFEPLPTDESFAVHAYPLPVSNADGAPVRCVAVPE